MHEGIQPHGEALRQAVRWLSERRRDSPGAGLAGLLSEAARRFDLSPLEEQFLFEQFLQSKGSEAPANPD